jgi:hypothetical protein
MAPEAGGESDERLMAGRPQQFVHETLPNVVKRDSNLNLEMLPNLSSTSAVNNTDISACQEPR